MIAALIFIALELWVIGDVLVEIRNELRKRK